MKSRMHAAVIEQTGPPEVIRYAEVPAPEPHGAQVLVRVGAVAVNPIDTYIRSGMIPMDLPKPFIVGCDVAGTVVASGPQATRFKVGDRVWGSNQGLLGRQGTFAEFVAIDEGWLYPTPENVSDEDAAATALVSITAHLGLVRHAHLHSGETIFINGGSGGVGSMVLQMAKALGARVITCAGSDEKVKACMALGADAAFNYKTQSVADEIKKIAPAGVNVWWETTREPDFELAVGAMAAKGRLILMAGREAKPAFPVGPFYVKCCSMHGFVMFLASPDEQRACAVDINRWLAEGVIRSNIANVLPLANASEAHRIQEESTIRRSGALSGKIVLKS